MAKKRLTIACVLKAGSVYDETWVLRLLGQLRHHMSQRFDFVCLSDREIRTIDTIPLQNNWRGWWSKIELFTPGLFSGPVLYFDLDTLIVGDIDTLASPGPFTMVRDFLSPTRCNSSVMSWDTRFRDMGSVYENFITNSREVIDLYDHQRPQGYIGDQAFIEHTAHPVQRFTCNRIVSYKRHCRDGIPEGASVICFHGTPKPIDAASWARELWEKA